MLTNTRISYNNFLWESGTIIEVDTATQALFLAQGVAATTTGTDSPTPSVNFDGSMADAIDLSQIE